MSEEIKIIQNEDGTFSEYDDTFDITIHCQSEEEQNEVLSKLNADPIDWISVKDELPEDSDAYLVTWKCNDWTHSRYIGICDWDAENQRWCLETMKQYQLYSSIEITAWADVEAYKEDI